MHPKVLTLAAAALLIGTSLSAQATGGLYLGGGVGAASVREDTSAGSFDVDHAGYKAFIGYRFDLIPLIDLAVEAAYTDFGTPSQTLAGQEVKFKLHGE